MSDCRLRVVVTHQLSGEERHVLDDGEAHPPLGVLGQLDDGGQQRLRQLRDADHLVHAVQVRDDVQSHLGALVFQLGQEQGQEVLYRAGREKTHTEY